MWGCFLMSGVKILHFLKDWWKSIPIHQNYTMALTIQLNIFVEDVKNDANWFSFYVINYFIEIQGYVYHVPIYHFTSINMCMHWMTCYNFFLFWITEFIFMKLNWVYLVSKWHLKCKTQDFNPLASNVS